MEPNQPVGSDRAPLNILLVEDNPDGRKSLQQLLMLLGHQVTAAADGEEGLSMGLKTRPDVAIIDINLPKMGGRQVAARLRGALGEAVMLIAYTAHDKGDGERRRPVFNDWVTKPAELPRLLASLANIGVDGRRRPSDRRTIARPPQIY